MKIQIWVQFNENPVLWNKSEFYEFYKSNLRFSTDHPGLESFRLELIYE